MQGVAKHTCPRRMNEIGTWERKQGIDGWHDCQCTFCGSLHPDVFMAMIENGAEIQPLTGPFKIEVEGFTFQYVHLTNQQRVLFTQLYQTNKVNKTVPGDRYVLPYFMRLGAV